MIAGNTADAGVLFALEGATEWPPDEPVRILGGWCVGVTAPIRGIELRVGTARLAVRYGIARADIAALHPGIPAAGACGFRVALALPPGTHDVRLVARRDEAPDVELFRRNVEVAFARLAGNLESPGATVPPGRVHVSGWCFHPQARVARVALWIGGATHACDYPMPRPDVLRALAGHPRAAESGFAADVDLAPGRYDVTIVAELESGESVTLDFPARIRVLSDSAVARGKRAFDRRVAAVGHVAAIGRTWITRRGHFPRPRDWPRLARKAWRLVGTVAPGSTHGLPGGFEVPPVADRYDAWLDWNKWTGRRAAWLEARLASAPSLPTISIVMPVQGPDRTRLDRTIASVRAQVHAEWELCIAVGANGDHALAGHLAALAAGDVRIKFVARAENDNISPASNSAAELATGDFLLFLDQYDELAPDAVGEIALALAAAPDADVLYTDDDKIGVDGQRYSPQFKPDWSPELLLSYMYVAHALVVRRSLFAELGGFRAGFEESQHYDFALRATEHARQILHLPLVLYHSHAAQGPNAAAAPQRPASFAAGLLAVDDALLRRSGRGRDGRHARNSASSAMSSRTMVRASRC
ncbi:MAG: glycosyltransferase [Casimicrobiaceae bacterium]